MSSQPRSRQFPPEDIWRFKHRIPLVSVSGSWHILAIFLQEPMLVLLQASIHIPCHLFTEQSVS